MTERGIIMSAPKVKALLDGSKKHDRRIMGFQPSPVHHTSDRDSFPMRGEMKESLALIHYTMGEQEIIRCPYGVAGDRLWVRETWAAGRAALPNGMGLQQRIEKPQLGDKIVYRATSDYGPKCNQPTWKPSIFMPRWASRITLEITGVRVERLQDISDVDCIAEGIEYNRREICPTTSSSIIAAYAVLWDSLHGKGAWELNAWVWVLEFKRL